MTNEEFRDSKIREGANDLFEVLIEMMYISNYPDLMATGRWNESKKGLIKAVIDLDHAFRLPNNKVLRS